MISPSDQRILAIDPGPVESGVVLLDGGQIAWADVKPTKDLVSLVETGTGWDHVAVEMIASYGMAVGAEVFDTCVQIGRICHASEVRSIPVSLVFRKDVKLHLCGTPRAKDPNIRQALVDRFGQAGTKKNPGGTYGVRSHAWAALAVAVTAYDNPSNYSYSSKETA